MPHPTARLALLLVIVSTIAVSCGDATPTGPAQEQSLAADRGPKNPARGSDPPPDAGLTATELLGDPLLHLLLESLRDPVGAGAITTAVEAACSSLEEEDTETARSYLQDAYEAMDSYLSAGSVDDEDVIHLDAAERFLDEVELLIGSEKSRGRKK
ncbi:MAG: hypothetical protein P8X82_12960 [Gemmatimonadales bacterium]|jgi:hypothetical protein